MIANPFKFGFGLLLIAVGALVWALWSQIGGVLLVLGAVLSIDARSERHATRRREGQRLIFTGGLRHETRRNLQHAMEESLVSNARQPKES